MKKITRLFTLTLAMLLTFGLANAQSTLMTKAQALGLKSSGIQHQEVKMVNASSRSVLLEEGFDGSWLPDGWTIIYTHPSENWLQSNNSDPTKNFDQIDPESLFSAMCPWIAEDQDEWLISPEIDAAGETPLNLTWYAGVSGPYLDPGATLICLISTDGENWTELWNAIDHIDAGADWNWNLVTSNLDAYASTPFQLAWNYVGNDGDLVGVDGVLVKSGLDYIFFDDFEGYNVGDYLALTDESGFWTTWTDSPGGPEDGKITDAQSYSPTQSVDVVGTTTDLILKMGNKTSGKYQFKTKYYVVSGFGGHLNMQHFESPGIEWAWELYFGNDGNGYINACVANAAVFTFAHNTWVQIDCIVDIDNDLCELYIDDELIHSWPFSCQANEATGTPQLGGMDFFAGAPTGQNAHYYFDDVEYILLQEGATTPVIEIDNSPITLILEEGTSGVETFSMGNTGDQDLEYQIVTVYPMDNKALNSTPAGEQPTVAKDIHQVVSLDPTPATSSNKLADRDEVLHYDGDDVSNAIGTASDYEWRVAAKFTPDVVAPYIGMMVSSVDVFINDPALAYKVQIYGMGSFTTPGPGELLYEADFTATAGDWNTIPINDPIYIDGSDIWVGYWLSATGDTYVPGCDAGPLHPNGDWMSSGPGWGHLSSNPDLPYNWHIRANLTGDPIIQWLSTDPIEGSLMKDEFIDVEVTLDATGLVSGQYDGKLKVRNNDPVNEEVNINVILGVTVGVLENGEQEYVAVYPNPANDFLRIKTNGTLTNVRIMNIVGQTLYSNAAQNSNSTINISELESGVYFVQIETELGTSTQKVVVE
jgi:hypothetical protein